MSKFDSGMEAMLDMFIFETNTLLEQLDEILLRTEKAERFGDEDINEIFRIMHTIKGSSAMMGLENMSTLSHSVEDLFYIIRENKDLAIHMEHVYDLVFQASDGLKAEVENIQSDDYAAGDFTALKDTIHTYAESLKNGAPAPAKAAASAPAKKAAPAAASAAPAAAPASGAPAPGASPDGLARIRVFFEEGAKMENLRAFLLVNKLRDECSYLEFSPADVETNPETAKTIIEEGFVVTFRPHGSVADVIKVIEGSVNVQSYEQLDSPAAAGAARPDAAGSAEGESAHANVEQGAAVTQNRPAKQNLISVNLSKLDQLLDVVGEIVITESMVTGSADLKGLELESFSKAGRQLRKLTDELQDVVMSIRMVPLSGTFQKMSRIVRDMKIKLGKEVDLVFEGEDTEVDKSIIDNLADPLMHLIRNAMDHGLEMPAQRLAAGKPAEGRLTLSAQSSSGEVTIVVSDDGAGIDPAKILRKAHANGILTKPDNEYTEREILGLIMMPGFSTNEQVTEFSGRGVGTDVVKKNIEKIGGTVSIESKLGRGTNFIIKIPLTLAIVDGMEISVGESIFTIPITSIRESFKAQDSQIIHDTENSEMIMIRGVCYPVVRMHALYGIETDITAIEDGILILVEAEERAVCVFADRLIGEQQVVVKPFPSFLTRYNIKQRGMAGCTILGDGSISLILDVSNLIGA